MLLPAGPGMIALVCIFSLYSCSFHGIVELDFLPMEDGGRRLPAIDGIPLSTIMMVGVFLQPKVEQTPHTAP
jgi:hypothetical protein